MSKIETTKHDADYEYRKWLEDRIIEVIGFVLPLRISGLKSQLAIHYSQDTLKINLNFRGY